jgi:hypothetical protein
MCLLLYIFHLIAVKMDNFSLTLEQTKVMYSLEYHLVLDDIDNESNPKKKSLKKEWLSKWKNSIESLYKNQSPV